MRFSLCVVSLLLGTAVVQAAPVAKPVAAPVVAEPLAEKDGLKVSIGEANLELRQGDPHISVVLQNSSSKPINVFQEWNSWGAYNLTLEITSVDGRVLDKPLVVTNGGMAWRPIPLPPKQLLRVMFLSERFVFKSPNALSTLQFLKPTMTLIRVALFTGGFQCQK